MSRRFVNVKKVVGGAVIGIILLVFTAILAAYIFENKIKRLAVKQVNKVLVARVYIKGKDITFSFIQHFPLASINFDNFIIKDPAGNGDLAVAQSMSVQFNPFDMLFGEYHIQKIVLQDATVNLKIDKHGRPNYIIWKTDTTAAETQEPVELHLKNISLQRVKVNYTDEQSAFVFENDIKEAFLEGKLYDDKFVLNTQGDFYFSKLSVNKVHYLKNQRIVVDAALDMDMPEQKYAIKEGKATINNTDFDISGYAQNLPKSVKVDYTIKSRQNKIQVLMALLPEEYANMVKDYESAGNVYFTAKINGIISEKENPAISVNFGVKNGRLFDKVNNIALEKVNCEGYFNNGKKHKAEDAEAELKNFSCLLKGKKITAAVYAKNFTDPYLRAKLAGSVSLADIKHFLPVSYMEKLDGNVEADVDFKGRVSDLKTNAGRSKVFISGRMKMKDVNVASKQYNADYTGMNASFVFDGNDLTVENFSGMAKGSDFAMQGEFKNLAAYILLPDQKFIANANFHSNHLRLEDFMTDSPPATTAAAGKDASHFTFPTFLLANLNVTINKFTFKRITATQLTGHVEVNEKDLSIKKGELHAFGGKINLTGNITTLQKHKFRSAFTGSCHDVEVSQLFYGLEDFGQEVVTHKNIHGTLTSKTVFSLDWNADLSPDLKTALATSDFVIDNGKLTDLEPLKKLGKFTEVKGLNHLTFSRLSNTLYVKDEQIIIPKMDIKSSAMDMTVAGTHTFANVMDFHITMNASQLVFGKKKSYQDEFGTVEVNENGGALVFVKMSGHVSDPKIGYDGAMARKQFKENIKKEASTLNKALNGEGPEGKPRENLNKPQKDYELSWDDETATESTENIKPSSTAEKPDPAAKLWQGLKKKFSTDKK